MPERKRGKDKGNKKPQGDVFDDALMRNSLRRDILEHLKRRPGMNRHQLAVTLDAHVNSIHHHIDRLLEAKFIEARRSSKGRETLFFTSDLVHLWDNESTRVLFGRGPPREVAEYFAQNPGADARQAAEALDLSIYSIRRQLRVLEENNLIERFRVDRQVIYRAAPKLVDWLQETGNGLGEVWRRY